MPKATLTSLSLIVYLWKFYKRQIPVIRRAEVVQDPNFHLCIECCRKEVQNKDIISVKSSSDSHITSNLLLERHFDPSYFAQGYLEAYLSLNFIFSVVYMMVFQYRYIWHKRLKKCPYQLDLRVADRSTLTNLANHFCPWRLNLIPYKRHKYNLILCWLKETVNSFSTDFLAISFSHDLHWSDVRFS